MPGTRIIASVELKHLSAFLVVSEERSFRRAAERLHLSPSPLSRYIRDLEAELGTALFERTTRTVRLTAAGEALVPHAVQMIASMEGAARSVDRALGKPPELLVGIRSIPTSFQRTLVDDVLRPSLPQGRWQIRPVLSELQVRALDQGAMAIGIGLHAYRRGHDRLAFWPILSEPIGVALPDLPRFRRLATVRPADLDGLTIISLTGQEGGAEEIMPGAAPYHEAAAGTLGGAGIIQGGIASLIQTGEYCAFTMSSDDSPWRRAIVGAGVIVRPLPRDFPRVLTSAAWLAVRDSQGDLGAIVAAVKAAYPTPLRL
ncbi:MAG: LysR family transcriptional regulator [Jatrophihabitantaceae bacterium]|nr:LysR family transcriptional regulator [Jatrophihabitantaceae bacterium]